ncbi:MAG: diacylglycerol kinase [Thermoleophilaceae bacterium]|nr:diacylglycerol kinase [Thermoleophilaceae bacterium]
MAGAGALVTDRAGGPLPLDGTLWIVNPIAGVGRGRANAERLRRELPAADVQLTTRAGEAAELARDAVHTGFHTVVVVGGDGTLTEVADAVIDEDPSGELAVGFVPAGTCNDFSRCRELSPTLHGLLDRARARRIDVGRVTYATPRGPESRHFVVNCTVGLVSRIGERFTRKTRANLALKRVSLELAQGVLGVDTLARWRPLPLRLTVDGTPVHSSATNLAVMKVPHFAGGLSFGDFGAIDDGRLSTVLLGGMSRPAVAHAMWRAFRRRLEGHPELRHWAAEHVRVECDRPFPVEVDGEIVGTTPAEFQVLPRRLLTIT